MHKIDLTIPEKWSIEITHSVTTPNDFMVSLLLEKALVDPGMFQTEIVDTRTYLVNGQDGKVIELGKVLSDELNQRFQCRIYDEHNKRFLTWYCGEGAGSASPVIAKNYKGKKISSPLDSDKYFSSPIDSDRLVNISIKKIAEKFYMVASTDGKVGRSFDIKNNIIK